MSKPVPHSPDRAAAARTSPAWPGITWGHNALCSCTWAPKGGAYQVKHRDVLCVVHIRGREGSAQ